MVFGMDVTHLSPQNREVERSVYPVVGSLSRDLMRYYAIVGQQDTSKRGSKAICEVIVDLAEPVQELIKRNGKMNNGSLPSRLSFYRDGVSEGQFQILLQKELNSIQKACKNIRPDYEPAITFITVQKRHHIRLFKERNLDNVEPGTVVDTKVTSPRYYDFYLCSHYGIQGTSKPAHYYVFYDDSDWGSVSLQRFTFCLCHAYMRCKKSVSIPVPTYYSHLCAFRAREWIKSTLNECRRTKANLFDIIILDGGFMYFL